ncbi:hypothetical protein [Larkinella soli]|uniref:hypothetical protein n=1 Tax=Larkinella soli TaxID=1770527 RepID=UPI000FFC2DAA|nr:hypothetical protein [Larkinella soli]
MITTNRNILEVRKANFAQSSAQLAGRLAELALEPADTGLIERAINDAIDLIETLEVQAATPKHLHGDTHHYHNRREIQSEVYVAQKTEYTVNGSQVENTLSIEVGQDKLYRLSMDLIISSNGRLVIRPISKKLITAVGEIALNDGEVSRLLAFLKTDFGV